MLSMNLKYLMRNAASTGKITILLFLMPRPTVAKLRIGNSAGMALGRTPVKMKMRIRSQNKRQVGLPRTTIRARKNKEMEIMGA